MRIPSQGWPAPAAKVHTVLDQRRGVPISLEDNCLRLIVVQVDLVLQGPSVPGPRNLHSLSGQVLELLELCSGFPDASLRMRTREIGCSSGAR